jgi:hypothetical protein
VQAKENGCRAPVAIADGSRMAQVDPFPVSIGNGKRLAALRDRS